MPAYRLALSADALKEQLPKRNLASGKRLAPLRPGLFSRVRGGPADTPLEGTTTDFAQTAPASQLGPKQPQQLRGSSRARNASESAYRSASGGLHNKSGRRHLPPVLPGEVGTTTSSSAFACTTPSAPGGCRSAPVDASHSRRASDVSNVNSGSAVATSPSSTLAQGVKAHASTSEGTRPRPSTTSITPTAPSVKGGVRTGSRVSPRRRTDDRSTHDNTLTMSSTAGGVSSGVSPAHVGRQKQRVLVLGRLATGSPPEASITAADAVGSAATNSTRAVRGRAAMASIALNSTANSSAHPSGGSMVGTKGESSTTAAAAESEDTSAAPSAESRVHITDPEFLYAPHDMDEHFYADKKEWCTPDDVPPLVWSLLEGTSLEAPYTTYLWKQAYPQPPEHLPAYPMPGARHSSTEHNSYSNGDSENTPENLPRAFQHCDSEKRCGGFYACVRCATPICSPDFQVVPAAPALRGIAVFSRLHLKGVDLRVRTGLEGNNSNNNSGSPRGQRQQRPSFTPACSSGTEKMKSMTAADVLLQQTNGGVQFLAHCHHCGGCLGAMFIGEFVSLPSSFASTATTASTTTNQPTWGNAKGDTAAAAVSTVAQELLCVNSVCLQYVKCRTRAALDGELLGRSLRADDAIPVKSVFGGATASMVGTVGALFGSPRRTTWIQRDDLQRGGADSVDGVNKEDVDVGSGGSSFEDMLDALNPYSGGGGHDSD